MAEDLIQDYALKCICGFTDADGDTTCCEKCKTWQHVHCYYADEYGFIPSIDEMEQVAHLCVDCFPRPLDVRRATMRQEARRARRGEFESSAEDEFGEEVDPIEKVLQALSSRRPNVFI